jgi:uncharacterized protein (DUF305 family)
MSSVPESSVFQRWGRRGTGIVFGLAAVVLLLIGATIGLAIGGTTSSNSAAAVEPPENSIDVGFLRDMSVHHQQGVLLAHIIQGEGGSDKVAGIAYDIEYQQTSQIGQMGGSLQLWDYSLNSLQAPMAWMTLDSAHADMSAMAAGMTVDPAAAADGAVMPGMATNTEIAKLKTLRGSAADILFLQLMIRHHEGGVPMMQYAAKYATNAVVKNMAVKMTQAQQAEIVSMTTMLDTTFHTTPLPSPGAAASSSAVAPSTGSDGSTDGSAPASSTGAGSMDMGTS